MNLIRQIREQAGLSQQKLALAAGTSQPTIADYESGRKSPTVRTLQKLASASGLEFVASFVPAMTREDKRSLAFHRAIVRKLEENPEPVLKRVRANLGKLHKLHPDAAALFHEWGKWLELSVPELQSKLMDPDLEAREMRQVSPFSGILSAKERADILRAFQKEMNNDPRAI